VKKKFLLFFLLVGFPCFTAPSTVSAYLVGGASGDLSASATFDVLGGGILKITLTNTSTADVSAPAQVLTALFFTIDQTLLPVSATLDGSTVFFDDAPPGGNVGGEWAYKDNLSGAPGGATQGISSSGFGLFASANFQGPNLDDPVAVDGLNYGITSSGDDPLTGNAAVTGGNPPNYKNRFPLIQDTVIFTLSGLDPNFVASADTITNISFQYGTSLSEQNVPVPVPEPATMLLFGCGLIGLVTFGRRKFFQ
jgi:hypothetical protein